MIDDDAFEELPEHEPAWATLDRITAYRKQSARSRLFSRCRSMANGASRRLDQYQGDNAIVDTWATTRADHLNTGVLCRDTPFIDIDVTVQEVAEEIETLFESEIENSAIRIGLPPKRAIPFRADAPFKKITMQFKDPNGQVHKLKFWAMARCALSTAFTLKRISPTAGMAASLAPSFGARICRR